MTHEDRSPEGEETPAAKGPEANASGPAPQAGENEELTVEDILSAEQSDAAAAAGTPVSGFGDEAYFSSTGGVGQVTAFSGAYWVVVRSVAFFEAGDAAPLMSSVLAAL